MRRTFLIPSLVGLLLAGLLYWVAGNTRWVDTKLPMPLKGEARTNPFYAAQRFAEALGARTVRDRTFAVPRHDAVIVLSAWHWNLSASRRIALERWVESGGRLVVDETLAGGFDEFERWSGIVLEFREVDDTGGLDGVASDEEGCSDPCRSFEEAGDGTSVTSSDGTPYRICNLDGVTYLETKRPHAWALRDASGIQALRVGVGRGSVTMINATPFRSRSLFDGDHGRLFVAATELRRGDDVHFLSEDDHPFLLTLAWRHGAPVVMLGLVLIALVLWRDGVRLGPLAATPAAGRRSLAEQIRGTGRFALRHGGGESLHAACVRALDEAATGLLPGYGRLITKERAIALARITGLQWNALASAIHRPRFRGPEGLRNTIALLETARRATLTAQRRSSDGTRRNERRR